MIWVCLGFTIGHINITVSRKQLGIGDDFSRGRHVTSRDFTWLHWPITWSSLDQPAGAGAAGAGLVPNSPFGHHQDVPASPVEDARDMIPTDSVRDSVRDSLKARWCYVDVWSWSGILHSLKLTVFSVGMSQANLRWWPIHPEPWP